jgi:hypothetical protein
MVGSSSNFPQGFLYIIRILVEGMLIVVAKRGNGEVIPKRSFRDYSLQTVSLLYFSSEKSLFLQYFGHLNLDFLD